MHKLNTFRNLLMAFSLAFLMTHQSSAQCGQRYHDKIFTDSVVSNIQYGVNIKSNNASQNLLLDIYFPKGDTQTNRPLFIIAHGGNFLGGSKTGTDVKPMAQDFARMGYVTSSIEYRVGMTNFPVPGPDSTDAAEAVMRAVHDSRAAVRFFKDSYANGNPYGIDTNQIFFCGVSAGGFMALHLAYMDDMAEFPSYIDTVGRPGLTGGLQGNSNSLDYSSDVTAIINICGAIADTNYIQAGDTPMMLFHGDQDQTVPYGSDQITLVGLYPLLQVDGSSSIAERANEKGIENCFEIYEGMDHTPHVTPAATAAQYYDTTLNITRNFMAKFVCNEALNCSYGPAIVGVEENEMADNSIVIYPNPAISQVEITIEDMTDAAEVTLYDLHGKLVFASVTRTNKLTIARGELASGIYFLKVITGENIRTSKLIFE
jgi:poly(3-hydroxybutyrate) depolymerase